MKDHADPTPSVDVELGGSLPADRMNTLAKIRQRPRIPHKPRVIARDAQHMKLAYTGEK